MWKRTSAVADGTISLATILGRVMREALLRRSLDTQRDKADATVVISTPLAWSNPREKKKNVGDRAAIRVRASLKPIFFFLFGY